MWNFCVSFEKFLYGYIFVEIPLEFINSTSTKRLIICVVRVIIVRGGRWISALGERLWYIMIKWQSVSTYVHNVRCRWKLVHRSATVHVIYLFAPFHFEISIDRFKLIWQGVNNKVNDSIGYDIVERFFKKHCKF